MDLNKHLIANYGTMYYVRDMNSAVKHYTKLAGKPEMESPQWTQFDLKGQRLCLHAADSKMKTLPGGIMILHVKGLTQLVEDLKKQGYKFQHDPHLVQGEDYTTHAIDMDGNELSFYGTLK